MAAQSGQPYLFHATAGRRLEHLLRRPAGRKRHHQRVSRSEIGGRAGDGPAHVEGAPGGSEPRRRAANEHLLPALSRVARFVPLGIRANDSLRSHPDRQMVSREFLEMSSLTRPMLVALSII